MSLSLVAVAARVIADPIIALLMATASARMRRCLQVTPGKEKAESSLVVSGVNLGSPSGERALSGSQGLSECRGGTGQAWQPGEHGWLGSLPSPLARSVLKWRCGTACGDFSAARDESLVEPSCKEMGLVLPYNPFPAVPSEHHMVSSVLLSNTPVGHPASESDKCDPTLLGSWSDTPLLSLRAARQVPGGRGSAQTGSAPPVTPIPIDLGTSSGRLPEEPRASLGSEVERELEEMTERDSGVGTLGGRCTVRQVDGQRAQSPRNLTAFSSDDITLTCEASGSPSPSHPGGRGSREFCRSLGKLREVHAPYLSADIWAGATGPAPRSQRAESSLNGRWPSCGHCEPPKWQKENIVPKEVEEGESVILPCNPPKSIVTPYIHWMDEFLRHIEQNERVTQGQDGNLYFSHVTQKDSRDDYICHAQFISARTILQKEPIKLKVMTRHPDAPHLSARGEPHPLSLSLSPANAVKNRKPSLLLPRGSQSSHMALRGQTLELECIAQGLPTPHLEWKRKDGNLPAARASLQSYRKLLRIENVVESDDGEYQCTASNDQGKATHTFTVTVQAAPYWTRVPESGLYAPGETMRLDCEAEGIPTPTVRWRMNGQWLDEIEKDDRRRVEGGTLILTDVQFGDTAVFQCEASNIHGTILTNTYTHIINLPPQILTESGQLYQLTEGQNAYLPCHAFGSPSPRLIWELKGESVLSNQRVSQFTDGALNISDVVREDGGLYICRVENFNISINATLEVFNRTEFEEVPTPLLLQPGEKATFHCVARGDPLFEPPQIMWRKNGRKIFSSDDSDKYTFTKRSLIVTDVEPADIGVYTCVAMGKLDTIEASAMLTVVDYPDPPYALQLSDPQSLSVRLSWTPGDNHNSPMQGDSASAFLDLWPFCKSRFRVIAINKLGKGKPSEPSDTYTTPHAAPDRNPRDVTGEGTSADNMVIRWKDMPATEHGAPGFQYKVMWRQASGEEPKWHENFTESPHFVVTNTPTFTAYEIKVQAVNDLGEGPPASPVIGFSGEDTPVEAPMNVGVEIEDSTTIKVVWFQVPGESVKGHLLGYKIYLKRLGGVEAGSRKKRFSSKRGAGHKAPHGPGGPDFRVVTVSGAKDSQVVSGLRPYSHYTVNMTVFNKIGEGPPSEPVAFSTPEGVPSPPVSLHFDSPTETSLTLHWEPPAQPNGILTGYILQYQKLLDSEVGEMAVSHYQSPLVSNVTLTGLDRECTYRFYLRATTATGEGEPIIRDAATLLEGGPPANISFSAGKTFANFTWVSGERYRNVDFHIHFLNKNVRGRGGISQQGSLGDTATPVASLQAELWLTYRPLLQSPPIRADPPIGGGAVGQDPWKVSEKVNSSQAFYQLQGLHPGSQYRLKFISRNNTFWETEIQTEGPGSARAHGGTWRLVGTSARAPVSTHLCQEDPRSAVHPPPPPAWGQEDRGLGACLPPKHTPVGALRQFSPPGGSAAALADDAARCKRVTRGRRPLEERGGFATQGWFIGLISAIVLLLLVLLILCFIKRSKGGKYSVKDKEEAHVDSEARPMKDETFGEYSDNEEKQSSASQPSLNGDVKPPGSDYSLADYGDSVDAQFNEDGSFIGQYSGRREGQGPGGHDSSGATSPVNPNHVGVPLE
ncbi:L1CAM protein, partial [Atractosteus spatula]|nr:L1CAM protein [Atractosteus spatula]